MPFHSGIRATLARKVSASLAAALIRGKGIWMSEHESLCSMKQPSRVCFEEQMIVDLRNRFFNGVDEDILFLQQPMRELQFIAEQASYERYQSRLSRLMKTIGETAQ